MKRLATVLVMAAGCSAGSNLPVVSEQAVIALDREPVQLPAAYVGTAQSESLQILNQGRGQLTITAIRLVSLDGGALPGSAAGGAFDQPLVAVDAGTVSDALPVQLGGLQTGFVQFNFAPHTAGRREAMLVIESDAPGRPHLTTTVSACAVNLDGGSCN